MTTFDTFFFFFYRNLNSFKKYSLGCLCFVDALEDGWHLGDGMARVVKGWEGVQVRLPGFASWLYT